MVLLFTLTCGLHKTRCWKPISLVISLAMSTRCLKSVSITCSVCLSVQDHLTSWQVWAKAVARDPEPCQLTLTHTETVVPMETWQYPLSSPYTKAMEGTGWKVAQKELTHFHNDLVISLAFSCRFPGILN